MSIQDTFNPSMPPYSRCLQRKIVVVKVNHLPFPNLATGLVLQGERGSGFLCTVNNTRDGT